MAGAAVTGHCGKTNGDTDFANYKRERERERERERGIQSFRHTVASSRLFLCDELTGG